MVQRPDGTIVLSTWGQGLVVAGGSPLQRLSQPEGLPDPRLTGLCLGDDGLVFCSPNMSGVWVLDGEDVRPLADNPQLASLDVLSIFHTTDGTLYLGTENQGINIWQDGELDAIGPANGMLGEVVKCFEEGSDGMIYVGTWGGLSIHDRDRMVVINSDQGLADNITTAITVSKSGNGVLFGFPDGRIQRYKNGEFETLPASMGGALHIVKVLIESEDGTLLIGSDYGVFRINGDNLQSLTLPDGEAIRSVNHIYPRSDGSMIVSAYGGIYQLTGDELKPLHLMESESYHLVYDLLLLDDEHFLVGTSHGLYEWVRGDWRLYSEQEELANGYFIDLHQLPNGSLVFGTSSNGVFIQQDEELVHFDKSRGLSDNSVLAITADDAGCMYLASNKGLNILCHDGDHWQVRVLNYNDGLASNECIEHAMTRNETGHILIGTIGGVSVYDPMRDRSAIQPPRLHLTGVSIYDDPVDLIEFAAVPHFAHHQNYLKLEFSGIYPPAPQNVHYRYRLSGVDPDWVESTRRFIQYTSLQPGRYEFELSAGLPGGPWSPIQSWTFSVNPPFWLTWWFLTLAVVVVVSVVVLLVTYRMRRLLAVERLRTRIAADLHDDIGSGLTEISILSEIVPGLLPANTELAASKHIERIGDTARSLVESMSDIVWLVSPTRDSLFDLVSRLGDFSESMGHGSGIRFVINNPESLREVHLGTEARQNIYLIFKEAINNTVKYSRASEVMLDVQYNGSRLLVKLSDDGVGFDTDKIKVKGSGNGLHNMHQRALSSGGQLQINSEIGEGTTVRLECRV